MSEAKRLTEMAGLDPQAPRLSRKTWQAPTIIKSETQSLASAENNLFYTEDGAPATNSPPS